MNTQNIFSFRKFRSPPFFKYCFLRYNSGDFSWSTESRFYSNSRSTMYILFVRSAAVRCFVFKKDVTKNVVASILWGSR